MYLQVAVCVAVVQECFWRLIQAVGCAGHFLFIHGCRMFKRDALTLQLQGRKRTQELELRCRRLCSWHLEETHSLNTHTHRWRATHIQNTQRVCTLCLSKAGNMTCSKLYSAAGTVIRAFISITLVWRVGINSSKAKTFSGPTLTHSSTTSARETCSSHHLCRLLHKGLSKYSHCQSNKTNQDFCKWCIKWWCVKSHEEK